MSNFFAEPTVNPYDIACDWIHAQDWTPEKKLAALGLSGRRLKKRLPMLTKRQWNSWSNFYDRKGVMDD